MKVAQDAIQAQRTTLFSHTSTALPPFNGHKLPERAETTHRLPVVLRRKVHQAVGACSLLGTLGHCQPMHGLVLPHFVGLLFYEGGGKPSANEGLLPRKPQQALKFKHLRYVEEARKKDNLREKKRVAGREMQKKPNRVVGLEAPL